MIHTQVGKRFMGCEDRSAHKTRRKRSSRASVIVFCHTIVNFTIVSAHPEEREREKFYFSREIIFLRRLSSSFSSNYFRVFRVTKGTKRISGETRFCRSGKSMSSS